MNALKERRGVAVGEPMLLDSRYRIRGPLRCKGAGRLDCAEDAATGARTAVRWLPIGANGASTAELLRQLPAASCLPPIRATGKLGEYAYVAMDFPEGRLLSTLPADDFSPEVLARIGGELAQALGALHQQNIVHGELSIDSVLMVDGDRALLWDLPLCLMDRLSERRGRERDLFGLSRHAEFLAPECASGQPATAASDVYSLGVLLCRAAGSGGPPGPTTLAVLHQISSLQWRPQLPASVSPSFADLLARMTAVVPRERPSSAQVHLALDEHRLSVVPSPPEANDELALGLRPARRAWALAAAAAAVIVGAFVTIQLFDSLRPAPNLPLPIQPVAAPPPLAAPAAIAQPAPIAKPPSKPLSKSVTRARPTPSQTPLAASKSPAPDALKRPSFD